MGKGNLHFLTVWIILAQILATFSSNTTVVYDNSTVTATPVPASDQWLLDYTGIVSKFSMRTAEEPEDDLCYIVPGERDTITECEFNPETQTFVIIHGWTVTGMFESWVPKLVSALFNRVPSANVIVVDWLTRANQHYPTSAAYTKLVGADVAKFVTWIQNELQLPWDKIHLLGYSLGAHVAGIAGDLTKQQISRITGLDPAGPTFEHADNENILSREDARFVDVLHTNTRGSPDRSIGIQRSVGHVDIFPNGGTFQPGCDIQNTLMGIASAGIKGLQNMDQLVKCSHERSIHLFIDSLVNADQQSMAYSCNSQNAFNKGLCLSCRKNRCNNIGYNAKKMRKRRNSKMYLKTRADTPFGGYHYQMKMHIFNRNHSDNADPTFHVKLYGAHNDTEKLFVDVPNGVGLNLTNTFLVFTEEEIGDLLNITLSWEAPSDSWNSFWKSLKQSFSNKTATPSLEVRRIRVKAGETQKMFTFCAHDKTKISPGESLSFGKCRDGWEVKPKKRLVA